MEQTREAILDYVILSFLVVSCYERLATLFLMPQKLFVVDLCQAVWIYHSPGFQESCNSCRPSPFEKSQNRILHWDATNKKAVSGRSTWAIKPMKHSGEYSNGVAKWKRSQWMVMKTSCFLTWMACLRLQTTIMP